VILGTLLLALLLGTGLGRAGVVEMEGVVYVHICDEPTAVILGGPEGGPYTPAPFSGYEPFTIWFIAGAPVDPAGGSLTLEWDFTYDGSTFVQEAVGPDPVSHTYADGPASEYVALRLSSTSGAQVEIVEPVNVINVVPTANVGGPYTGTVGSPVIFTGFATDPGSADTAAGFIYEWDFDYVDTFTADWIGHDLTTSSYIYQSDGTFMVALRVTDKDGGVSAISTTTVTVAQL
jgi:hypothetical protein